MKFQMESTHEFYKFYNLKQDKWSKINTKVHADTFLVCRQQCNQYHYAIKVQGTLNF